MSKSRRVKRLVPDLLEELDRLGVSFATLYPDFEGLVATAEGTIHWPTDKADHSSCLSNAERQAAPRMMAAE